MKKHLKENWQHDWKKSLGKRRVWPRLMTTLTLNCSHLHRQTRRPHLIHLPSHSHRAISFSSRRLQQNCKRLVRCFRHGKSTCLDNLLEKVTCSVARWMAKTKEVQSTTRKLMQTKTNGLGMRSILFLLRLLPCHLHHSNESSLKEVHLKSTQSNTARKIQMSTLRLNRSRQHSTPKYQHL